ncbi:MAG: hypothetical protein GXO49_06495 [Chlorobi bacterium]|nr:hypothetical protein [Chlorobiota bacterium]
MKNKLIKILIIPVILIFALWLFRFIYNKIEYKKEKAITYILSDKEKKLINNGDIILRRGYGMISDYIVNSFNEKYKISHSGIIEKKDGKINVIHSESSSLLKTEGIQKQSLDEFTDAGHKNSVIIVRFNKCSDNEYNKITNRANYYLNKKIPFSYTLKPKDTTQMFCSEVIWHIFLDEFNVDIFSGKNNKTDFYQFKNFWDTTYFDVIINHQNKKHLKNL